MYEYIEGTIKRIENNYIVIDNSGIGYMVYTANPYSFNLGEKYLVYIYHHVREDEVSLYGFKELEEKELFLKLISVKGVGCKMALPIIALGSIAGIVDAIERENIIYLKKFPKIGDKVARQIILDLKGKLVTQDKNEEKELNEELAETLKSLGYKASDIKKVVSKVDSNASLEEQIKESLRLLLK